jgi:hypothetical protein
LRSFQEGDDHPKNRTYMAWVGIELETGDVLAEAYPKSDGSGYGKLGRGSAGGKPTFSDGQRWGFVNRSDRCDHPDHPDQVVVRVVSPVRQSGTVNRDQTTTGIG